MGFFSLFTKREKSKDVARERLKMVLVQDRSDISPVLLDKIEEDLREIISKYVTIDESGLDLKLTRMKKEDSTTISALVANIPFVSVKEKI